MFLLSQIQGIYRLFFVWKQPTLASESVTPKNEKPMPRQTFLTREAFLTATDAQVKNILLSLPEVMPALSLVGENKLIEQMRFAYDAGEKQSYFIDISVLPVNDLYTRLSLHAEYKNGKAFQTDPEMNITLHDIEIAVQSILKGEVLYFPLEQKTKSINQISWFTSFKSSFAFLFLKKRLS